MKTLIPADPIATFPSHTLIEPDLPPPSSSLELLVRHAEADSTQLTVCSFDKKLPLYGVLLPHHLICGDGGKWHNPKTVFSTYSPFVRGSVAQDPTCDHCAGTHIITIITINQDINCRMRNHPDPDEPWPLGARGPVKVGI